MINARSSPVLNLFGQKLAVFPSSLHRTIDNQAACFCLGQTKRAQTQFCGLLLAVRGRGYAGWTLFRYPPFTEIGQKTCALAAPPVPF